MFFITIGYFGNVATFVTLKFEKGLRLFTNIMLCMVAFWDTMLLIFVALHQIFIIQDMSSFTKTKFYLNVFFTNSFVFTSYCSIWHLSVTALERMCFVVWPTNPIIRRASVREAVIISVFFILFALFLSNIPFIFEKFGEVIITSYLNFIFSVIIPFILLSSSSVILLYKLNKIMNNINPFPTNQIGISTVSSAKMVIVVSVYYLLSTIPISTLIIISSKNTRKIELFNLYEKPIFSIFLILWVSNNSIKFHLYMIFIPHVRKEFINICKKIIYKIKQNFMF